MTFQPARDGDRLIPVEEAQRRVLAEVQALPTEEVALADALGRVLRESVIAPADLPQRDNSAMDGYAVVAADTTSASPATPIVIEVIDDLPAGRLSSRRLTSGTAIRIMTGALMPEGADAVVQVEHVQVEHVQVEHIQAEHVQVERPNAASARVSLFAPVSAGTNIRLRGEDMRRGDVILHAGTPLGPSELGVLAAAQQARVVVGRRPTVAILSTGDELVDLGADVPPGKIVNSNAFSLAAMAAQCGAVVRTLGIVPDTREATIAAIESALDADFILSSGGVSVGAYDFVKDALDSLGAETRFWRVAMKPGKPVVLSALRGRLYFGLPGNPVSCLVAFILFVAPALRRAMGQESGLLSPTVQTRLAEPLTSKGERRTYLRVRVVAEEGTLVAHPMRAQGSGVSTSMIGANGLAIIEEGVTRLEAGASVGVVLFGLVQS